MKASDCQLRPVEQVDYENLADFLLDYRGKTYKKELWLARFRHWWDENPWYFPAETPRGLLLIAKEKIVGFFGVVASPYQVEHKAVTLYSATTWSVKTEYRSHALRLLAEVAVAYAKHPFFFINPVTNTEHIYPLLRYKTLPIPSPQIHIIFSGPGSFLLWKFKGFARLKKIVDRHSHLILAMEKRLLWLSPPPASSIRVEMVTQAGDGIDQLWHATKEIFSNTRLRSSAYLNWMAFGNAMHKKWLFVCLDGNKTVGYGLFFHRENIFGNALHCLDYWYDPDIPEIPRILFEHVKRFAVNHYYSRVTFYENFLDCSWVEQIPFRDTDSKNHVGFFRAPDHMEQAILHGANYLMQTDGDFSL